MNVTIRKRKLKKEGCYSLYLDCYVNGKQRQENLKLYLENEKGNSEAKLRNKQTMQLAEKIKTEELLEIQNGIYDKKRPKVYYKTFNEYFYNIVKEREKIVIDAAGWDSAYKRFNKFNDNVSFSEITENFLEEYKSYLERNLKQNTAVSYFSKLKIVVHRAHRANLISDDPAEIVKLPKAVDANREYLTTDELEKLANTPCRYDVLKRAFLFSCLTGLRWSDCKLPENSAI
jgi:integrase